MDTFTFILAISLGSAGWFLCRDFVRFISSFYTLRGKVISIQQAFVNRKMADSSPTVTRFSDDGFYPVIEYELNGERTIFTAIGDDVTGQLHIGDTVYLKFFKTRRSRNRLAKFSFILMALVAIVFLGLVVGAAYSGMHLSKMQIYQASFVLAVCFSILVFYIREQDENKVGSSTQGTMGRYKLGLSVPCAFQNWVADIEDRKQAIKILVARTLGSLFILLAFLIVVLSFSV